MPVANVRIKKLEGERKESKVTQININANSGILSVKKAKDKSIGDYLLVNYKYAVEYEPGLGRIAIEGSLWYYSPDLEKQYKEVEGKVELTSEAVTEISTVIIQDSLMESIDLARRLQLPPPMQLPKVEIKPKKLKFAMAS